MTKDSKPSTQDSCSGLPFFLLLVAKARMSQDPKWSARKWIWIVKSPGSGSKPRLSRHLDAGGGEGAIQPPPPGRVRFVPAKRGATVTHKISRVYSSGEELLDD